MQQTSLGIDIGGTRVKLAAVRAGDVLWTARGAPYHRPSRGQLADAIRGALAGRAAQVDSVGVCVPGLLDDDRRTVRQSVNVPGLNGVLLDDLVADALGPGPRHLAIVTDANATGIDLYLARRLSGRLFVLAVGAGVGASVIDDGARPLSVDGDSPGHFGQMDVSIEGEPVVGPDGGAGSLEGYLSAAALSSGYGGQNGAWVSTMRADDPPMRALTRAVRIAHALYRPHHVCLAGGIGMRMGHLLPDVRRAVEHQLTRIARPDWTLSTGESDFHAAQGAARTASLEHARYGSAAS
jgi:predicted NBD/HSP70 family sugar kinase